MDWILLCRIETHLMLKCSFLAVAPKNYQLQAIYSMNVDMNVVLVWTLLEWYVSSTNVDPRRVWFCLTAVIESPALIDSEWCIV